MSKFKIGDYRLGKLLGIGTFGVVRLGVNELTNQEVAVKIYNKNKLKQMKVREKIQREIHLGKMFDHPHVIKLYEYLDTKEEIYVIFEYISNGELFDLISNKGQLGEEDAIKYFHQIISALDYVHGFGIAHRDLKPENILLDKDGNIKIVDFGLSNVMKEGRALKTSCGSPNYAAPEVINGKPYDGSQIDVWSGGIILYAMLYGELPFDEENINTMFKYIKEAKYYMKGATSIEAKDLLNRMLQPNSFKRITLPEIIAHPWFGKAKNAEIVRKLNSSKLLVTSPMVEKQLRKFNRSLHSKKSIGLINKVHRALGELDSDEELRQMEENNKRIGEAEINQEKSFHTHSTSSEYLKEAQIVENYSHYVGFVFRSNLNDVFKEVFSILREMKIIWKAWNSNYVYKGQTGISVQEPQQLTK